jgi:hypothetical protein
MLKSSFISQGRTNYVANIFMDEASLMIKFCVIFKLGAEESDDRIA